MVSLWRLRMLIALGTLLSVGAVAHAAYILTVNAGYQAGPPPTSQPSGTGSVPVAKVYPQYQVKVDYGTLAGGNFTVWNGGPTAAGKVAPDPAGNFTWKIDNPLQLTNPPAGLHVRAQLQHFNQTVGKWRDDGSPVYAACP